MVWLIAKREFKVRTLSKASIISSLILLVLAVGGALIAKPFLVTDSEPAVVQVDSSAAELVPYLDAVAGGEDAAFEFIVADVAAPEGPEDFSEDVSGVIAGSATEPELFLPERHDALALAVAEASQAAAFDASIVSLGGDPADVATALAESTPTVTVVGEEPTQFEESEFLAAVVVVIMLFFVLIQSASVIMMGVVEEKSSRVVEILLSTVRPGTLLGGKVLGVGLYAIVQAAAMVLPILFGAWYLEILARYDIDVQTLLVNFSVWFVLGFSIFTVLFGGLAALVSRQEDLGAVTTPMMFLMMIPLYLAIYLVPLSPEGTATRVLTQVPFFAPFMVPMRTAFGSIETWEIMLAVVLCLVTIPALVWVAGRVYSRAVLNTGGRMKLTEALRG